MFTGDKILAEADKFDKIWAVGLEHDDLIKWLLLLFIQNKNFNINLN